MSQFSLISEVVKAVDAGNVVYVGNRNSILSRDMFGDLVITHKPWSKKVETEVFHANHHAASEFFTQNA